jgi:glycosyltransferase involved in cell wall biosynthesis
VNRPVAERPRVALLAATVEPRNAVPRVVAEHVRRLHSEVDFVVVSHELDPSLRPLVAEWRRVPTLGRRSLRGRQAAFFLAAPWRLRGVRADLVHSVMMLVPSRVDLASVHWCYAAVNEAGAAGANGRFRVMQRFATLVERWCFTRRAHVLGAVSSRSRADLQRLFPGARVELIPNGVDHGRFRPDGERRAEIRKREGVAEDEIVVLYVARLGNAKGLPFLIEGFARAHDTVERKARLWVVGGGDRERFERLAALHGVAERTHFFGFQDEVVPFFQGADIFALPSLREEFSLVVVEAAASGLGIVASASSGVAEDIVGADEGGLIVAPDPAAVGAALAKLIEDDDLRARFGLVARRRSADYTWERSAAALLGVYRRLLAEAPATTAASTAPPNFGRGRDRA